MDSCHPYLILIHRLLDQEQPRFEGVAKTRDRTDHAVGEAF